MFRRDDYTLLPLQEADLKQVLEWRNSDRVRTRMNSDQIIAWNDHVAWFSRLKNDAKNLFFVCCFKEKPIGVAYINDIDIPNGKGFWGFYLGVEETAPPGSGAVMELFILEYAFETLGLRKLYAEVLASNAPALALIKRFGFQEEGRFVRHLRRGGGFEDVVILSQFSENWSAIKSKVQSLLFPSVRIV